MDRWGQSRRRPGSPFGGQRGGGYHGYANPGGPPPIVTGGPPLFPSAYPSAAPHHHPGPLGAFSANEPRFRDSSSPSEATTGSSCEEQLFPPGKVADLEKNLQKQNDHTFIGLEYVIEIQHNTVKKMQHNYSCLLCDSAIHQKRDNVTSIDLMKNHLRSSVHKTKYLAKFFPILKKEAIDKSNSKHDTLNRVVSKIVQRQGLMKVKIVVGAKLFKRKSSQIKDMIEQSTHFREDDDFLEEMCGKGFKTQQKPSRMDAYADVFEQMEREEEDRGSRSRRDGNHDQDRSSRDTFSLRGKRNIDDLPLEGINPVSEAEVAPKREPERVGVSPPRGNLGPTVPVLIDEKSKSEPEIPGLGGGGNDGSPSLSLSSFSMSSTESPVKSKKPDGAHRRSGSPLSKRRHEGNAERRSSSRRRSRSRSPTASRHSHKHHEHRRRGTRSRSRERHSHPRLHDENRASTSRASKSPYRHTTLSRSKEYGGHRRSGSPPPGGRPSRSRSPGPSPPRSVSSSPETRRKHLELDGVVEEFLAEEKKMLAWLDDQKRKYLADRESHPDYALEWNRFYKAKCKTEGTSLHPSMVKDEWDAAWHKFLMGDHRNRVEEQGTRLMRKLNLHSTEIREYHARKKRREEKEKRENPRLSLVDTLRMLNAIEHLLDQSGPRIMMAFVKAKGHENREEGSSSKMLEDEDFLQLLANVRTVLQQKMAAGQILPNQEKAVRSSIDNINVLCQGSSQNAPNTDSIDLDVYNSFPLKRSIAETIVNHFGSLNQPLAATELDQLVQSEFNRVQAQQTQSQPQYYQQQQQQQQQQQHYNEQGYSGSYYHQQNYPQDPYSRSSGSGYPGYDGGPAAASTSCGSHPPSQVQEGLGSSSLNIDWGALQNAVATAGTSADSVKQEAVDSQAGADGEEDDGAYDDLTLDELTSLFKNFKDLDGETQKHLITYMKKLEKSDPAKVAELKANIQGSK